MPDHRLGGLAEDTVEMMMMMLSGNEAHWVDNAKEICEPPLESKLLYVAREKEQVVEDQVESDTESIQDEAEEDPEIADITVPEPDPEEVVQDDNDVGSLLDSVSESSEAEEGGGSEGSGETPAQEEIEVSDSPVKEKTPEKQKPKPKKRKKAESDKNKNKRPTRRAKKAS